MRSALRRERALQAVARREHLGAMMLDLPPDRVLLREVQEGAEAMALLVGDDETFRAAGDASRAHLLMYFRPTH